MNGASPKLRDVLRALFGSCDGLLNVRAFGPGYTTSCFYALTDTQGLAAFLGTHVSIHDCYVGMSTRVDDSSGDATNCLHLNALFVDLDFKTTSEPETRQRLANFLYLPSMVWHSGGGLHCVWLLAEPFDLRIAADAAQAGSLLRRLAICLEADTGAAEVARILRIPRTFNRKAEYETPRAVVIEVFEPTRRYQPSDFDMILPTEPPTTSPSGPFVVPDVVGPSERNPTLFKLGRSLKAKKIVPSAILAALQATNAAHCQPPHSEAEVLRVFESVMKRRDRVKLASNAPTEEAPASPAPQEAPAATESTAESTTEPVVSPADTLAALLDDTARYLRRFVVMTDHQSGEVSLWVAHSHTFMAAECTPYQHVTAATKRAGKTLLLEILEPIVANAWLTGRTTAAALPRKIDAVKPTLLLDETDQALTENSDYSKALIGVLNSGYRRSGTTSLCIGEGNGLKVVDLATFCPKAIAGIGKLPDTVADRSIRIKLRRRTREERIERARARTIQGAAKPLRQRWQAWAPAAARELLGATPTLPEALDDRAQDVWEPLLAIAALAGEGWTARARAAAVALSGSRDDEDYATLLLSDIREVMNAAVIKDERGSAFDVISSTSLLKKLNRLKEHPWPTWSKGQPMTAHALAKLLAGFEVESTQHWIAGRNVRGYARALLDALFPRYLPSKVLEREEPNKDGGQSHFSKREEPAPSSTSKSEVSPITTGVPPALALQTPEEARPTDSTPPAGPGGLKPWPRTVGKEDVIM